MILSLIRKPTNLVALILPLILTEVVLSEDAIGCYVPGECIYSRLLADYSSPDPFNCALLCNESEESESCNFFTYLVESKVIIHVLCNLFPTILIKTGFESNKLRIHLFHVHTERKNYHIYCKQQ